MHRFLLDSAGLRHTLVPENRHNYVGYVTTTVEPGCPAQPRAGRLHGLRSTSHLRIALVRVTPARASMMSETRRSNVKSPTNCLGRTRMGYRKHGATELRTNTTIPSASRRPAHVSFMVVVHTAKNPSASRGGNGVRSVHSTSAQKPPE